MFQSKENQRWTALIQSCFSLKQLCSALKQRCSALKQRCSALKQRWIFQFWTALIQRKSELISSETELISADVYHVLWISAEKRRNYETALSSADYLWDFTPGSAWYKKYKHCTDFCHIQTEAIYFWREFFTVPEGRHSDAFKPEFFYVLVINDLQG